LKCKIIKKCNRKFNLGSFLKEPFVRLKTYKWLTDEIPSINIFKHRLKETARIHKQKCLFRKAFVCLGN